MDFDLSSSRNQEELPMQKNYVQEILSIIHSGLPKAELAEKLSDYHEKDLADALEALTPAERQSLYSILGVDTVAEIFTYLDDAEPYLKELPSHEAAKVISNMDSDDAVDALEDLDDTDKNEIVNKLDKDSVEDVKMLLSYDEDEIGSRMTTNYISIKNDMTIRQAMSELVKQAGENDNISTLYVVDKNEHFYGAIDLKDLIIARAMMRTNTPLNNLHDIRCQLKDTLDKYKVDFWQTGTCIMGNDEEIGGGGGYDFTMKTALYVARIIHHDIVYAGARSWQWWRSIGGDYKDGLIREYSDPTFLNGEVKDSKLMWALGNYSRFIRPGAVRKAIIAKDNQGKIIPEGDTDVTGLMCSAYQNTDGKEVFVMINYAAEDKEFTFYQRNGIIKNWKIYRTSDKDGENLLPVGSIKNHEKVVIPARSIITLVTQ